MIDMDNYAHKECVFLAEDCVNNIRHVKDVSRYILAVYTAAFGFVWNYCSNGESFILLFLFLLCGVLAAAFCGVFVPLKLYERRTRLYDIYTKGFGESFREIYGKKQLDNLRKNDPGDWAYVAFSMAYPVVLMLSLWAK
jgi:hypothetical protein